MVWNMERKTKCMCNNVMEMYYLIKVTCKIASKILFPMCCLGPMLLVRQSMLNGIWITYFHPVGCPPVCVSHHSIMISMIVSDQYNDLAQLCKLSPLKLDNNITFLSRSGHDYEVQYYIQPNRRFIRNISNMAQIGPTNLV